MAVSTPIGTELDARHHRAIDVLVAGGTQVEAANAADVSPQTIRTWLRWPTFRAEYEAVTDEVVGEARAILKRSARRAAEVLADAVEHADTDAALAILDRIGLAKGAKIEHSGPNGGPVQVDVRSQVREALRALTDDDVVPP